MLPADAASYARIHTYGTSIPDSFSRYRSQTMQPKTQNQLQDTRHHVMHHNSHPAGGPSLPPPQKHSGVSPLHSCAVVFVRGLLLARRVGTGVFRVVARVGRVVAEGLHAGSSGGVVGLQRALARPVEDDAGVDEETDEGGAREGESSQQVVMGRMRVRRIVNSQDDDWDDNVQR